MIQGETEIVIVTENETETGIEIVTGRETSTDTIVETSIVIAKIDQKDVDHAAPVIKKTLSNRITHQVVSTRWQANLESTKSRNKRLKASKQLILELIKCARID